MFDILDNEGNVVDTATSFAQAASVVTHLDNTKRASGPHRCVSQAAAVSVVPVPAPAKRRLFGRKAA